MRARQRDRASSLPGFDRNFPPQTGEWAIDKLLLKITGRWRTSLSSGPDFFALRFWDGDLTWLRTPDHWGSTISVESIHPSPLTLSQLKISATRCNDISGRLIVDLAANPTRTLSSLIQRFGERDDFQARIFMMDPLTFFGLPPASSQLPPSLDGADNYLPEHPSARELLGGDPFATFMPTYIAKVQELLARVLAEHGGGVVLDGAEQLFSSSSGSIRLDWGSAAVPQIETYFERFHRNAVAAVRGAATSVLDADTNSRVTLYPPYQERPGFERNGDRLSLTATINTTIDSRHILSVYAKTPSRIRFEVRRVRRGRYGARTGGNTNASAELAHAARLLRVLLDLARHDASRLIRWNELFGFFEEPDVPSIGDLAHVMGTIFRAASGSPELYTLLVERLIVDGGLSVGVDDRITAAAVGLLQRAGIIEVGRIRHRRPPSYTARYRLTRVYQSMRQRMLVGLVTREDET